MKQKHFLMELFMAVILRDFHRSVTKLQIIISHVDKHSYYQRWSRKET